MNKIIRSVGRSAVNHPDDIKIVQRLLNRHPVPSAYEKLAVDGKAGPRTIRRIEEIQQKVLKFSRPDGRVDPSGRTFLCLAKSTEPLPAQFINWHLTFSESGVHLLKQFESLALKPYDDQTGSPIQAWVVGATIGYGHLITRDQWERYKSGISEAQAVVMFAEDIQPYAQAVKTAIDTELLQNQFDALVIFAFNIGPDAFSKSSVVKLINDPTAITSYLNLQMAWMAWTKSQGKEMKGLVHRRIAEWNLYDKGIY